MPLLKDQPAGCRGPRYTALCDWLAWQEGLHVREIDLGLERCQSVKKRMGLAPPVYRVISVGGTNGKGSSVSFLDAILRAAGYRVATYTSRPSSVWTRLAAPPP
ncbi:MAG: hypothetical protein LC647_04535 [Beggiatoa sp.]|nr:hypothetical protein [Beggiatoa sp.]